MPGRHSTFISEHSFQTFCIIKLPNTKHSPPLRRLGTVFRFPAALPAAANHKCSSSALFFFVRSSSCSKAFCTFSYGSLSLSDLHLSQIHFPLRHLYFNITTAVMEPASTRVTLSSWFEILSHLLHKTCIIFSTCTPGPGFFSTPPITSSTAKVVAHRIIVPKQNITHPFFHSCTMHLDTINFFYLPTDAHWSCFKRISKFTLKQLLHVSV